VKPALSVILCTHNPRPDFLNQTLEGLENQDFESLDWELLIIDNASEPPLAGRIDLKWHPNARVIREEKAGLVPARLKGFREAQGDVFVCLDDDVILNSDYLSQVERISQNFPNIGFWGTQIRANFEVEPEFPLWFYGNAERQVKQDIWSNLVEHHASSPWGAGSCIRREVAERYAELLKNDPRRLILGRKENQRLSCEDMDMSLVCCEMGFGKGIFKSLELIHLFPKEKMTWEALMRTKEGNVYSYTIHNFLTNGDLPAPKTFWQKTYWLSQYFFRWNRYQKSIERAKIKKALEAVRDMKSWGWLDSA
jgi:glycosyltransferase involved in cell wall biosynthesis